MAPIWEIQHSAQTFPLAIVRFLNLLNSGDSISDVLVSDRVVSGASGIETGSVDRSPFNSFISISSDASCYHVDGNF